ncbi:MAG: hypothetical protein PGN07_03810 [Aeromicrobium erythreum]
MSSWVVATLAGAMLTTVGCSMDDGDARQRLADSMQATESRLAAIQRVVGSTGEVRKGWDACGSAPAEAVSASVATRVPGDPTTTIEMLRDRLREAGWSVDDDVDNAGLRSIVMVKGDERVDLTASEQDRRGGASWSLTGDCVRVPRDLANEKLAESP